MVKFVVQKQIFLEKVDEDEPAELLRRCPSRVTLRHPSVGNAVVDAIIWGDYPTTTPTWSLWSWMLDATFSSKLVLGSQFRGKLRRGCLFPRTL